jgi:tetratricopeptide (TPR) repeat protein
MLAIEVNDLRAVLNEIEGGHPVLVMQNLSLPWFPQWHYAVAMGYDLAGPQMILRSGTEPRRVTPLDAFERTWQRADNWAVVILQPHQAPVNMAPTPWLQAIAGLERAGRPADALTAYRRFLRAHPGSTLAQLGEANALLALEEYDAAEERYRAVLDVEPERAAAWNNLAYALHFQGRRNDAIAAAERALDAGGGDPNYADTLREVSQ